MSAQLWTDGQIRRPVADFLDPTDFRKLFGISDDQLSEFVRMGIIPEPARLNSRVVMYSWKHAIILAARIEMKWFPENVSPSEIPKGVKGRTE